VYGTVSCVTARLFKSPEPSSLRESSWRGVSKSSASPVPTDAEAFTPGRKALPTAPDGAVLAPNALPVAVRAAAPRNPAPRLVGGARLDDMLSRKEEDGVVTDEATTGAVAGCTLTAAVVGTGARAGVEGEEREAVTLATETEVAVAAGLRLLLEVSNSGATTTAGAIEGVGSAGAGAGAMNNGFEIGIASAGAGAGASGIPLILRGTDGAVAGAAAMVCGCTLACGSVNVVTSSAAASKCDPAGVTA
jgi:hypothetical protein